LSFYSESFKRNPTAERTQTDSLFTPFTSYSNATRLKCHYPSIGSAKDYLLIWRPDEAGNSTLLNKLIAYRLFVTPAENITLPAGCTRLYFNGYFQVNLGWLV